LLVGGWLRGRLSLELLINCKGFDLWERSRFSFGFLEGWEVGRSWIALDFDWDIRP